MLRMLYDLLWFITRIGLYLGCAVGPLIVMSTTVSFFITFSPEVVDQAAETIIGRISAIVVGVLMSALSFSFVFCFRRQLSRKPYIKTIYVAIFLGIPLALTHPFVAVASLPIVYWLDRRRIPPGHCRNCRYNLTANSSGRCPECGEAIEDGFDHEEPPEFGVVRQTLGKFPRAVWIMAALLMIWGGVGLAYRRTDWPARLPEGLLMRLRDWDPPRVVPEIATRFRSGTLSAGLARDLFHKWSTWTVEVRAADSDPLKLLVVLRADSEYRSDRGWINLEELEVLVDGRSVVTRFKASTSDGGSFSGTYETAPVSPGRHSVHVRATASWRSMTTFPQGGAPLHRAYGWLIDETVAVVVQR